MKISRKRVVFLLFMSFVVYTTISLIVNSYTHVQSNPIVLFTFFINIILSVICFLKSINKHPFSLDMMFWLFNVIFFGAAPLLQYLTNSYAWALVPTSEEVFKTNILILVWLLCYLIGMNVTLRKEVKYISVRKNMFSSCQVNQTVLNCFVAVSIGITIYYLLAIGLNNLIYRETNGISGLSSTMSLLTEHGFKNTVLFTAVFCVIDSKQRHKITIKTMIALACLVISCFPTGIPRNMMASFYAGLLIIMYDKTRKGRWFSFAIFAGLILIFPALNVFRNIGNGDANILESIMKAYGVTYLEGNYDAHQMFISVQRYVDEFGFKYFYQILGALLFFIPRSLWSTKPIGTGHTVISELNQFYFTNVSAPLASEWYIGFGWFGIIIGSLILSKIIKKFDNKYWDENNDLSPIRIIYPCSIFMFFFMLRGDLLSSWAYTFAQIVVGMIMCKMIIKKHSV